MDKILNLDSVDLYNKLYGLETLNPLVSVIDLNKATSSVDLIRFNYGIYALYLKLEKACDIKYGRQTYDYQEGTIVCFAPGQTAETNPTTDKVQSKRTWYSFSSRFTAWNVTRKEYQEIYVLFLRGKRGVTPLGRRKIYRDGLPEDYPYGTGAWRG